jgi:hypothetical protein
MQLTLQIDLGQGPVQVKTNLMVIVNWERKYKRKASQLGEGGIGMEDLAFMAHEACKVCAVPVPLMLDDFIGNPTPLFNIILCLLAINGNE